ncbi:unnamed protein product [Rotaria sordida]|uniref:N-acetyltransferase domain-containing protein n=1 Tax=Rotaria sordida TaxID=392033 RepID=A0A815I9Y6_9BILA|nr:unnamed protein product [Rotaria sordida]CAF1325063.1 unnamed protein product [Rotaria sordida]CAF1359575.1 unnamed protein product [Rotaria sordida]CAF1365621.1 unnamed protein product [Rotaria sordida]CAF1588707.1 unnamed protein product [Rotaria sordida]
MRAISITNRVSIDSGCTTSSSDPLVYRVATTADCDLLVTLINSSYRGELAYQGWTNENEIAYGPRTTTQAVLNKIVDDKYVVLVFFGKSDHILKGCIYLEHKPESKTAWLSTFAVRPDFQRQGYGKLILSVAENYAVNNWNVEYIELNVMIQRSELVAFYNRRGYIDTGHHQTFSLEQLKSGGALRYDLERCTMRKCVKNNENKTS